MNKLLFVLLVLLGHYTLPAQILLKGRTLDLEGKPIARINILIYPNISTSLVAFAVSDLNGYFEVEVESETDSIELKISSINYQDTVVKIPNTSQEINFHLTPDIIELESVTIKASPIEQKGDTISYLVNSFAKGDDRTIEDVLRQMPGIEVEAGGRILYQGMPLKKFYIEGLDLLDGRYTVISRNLPHNSVGVVEIIENHQPIKILEKRVHSYQPSMNLKLKRNITTTGTAELGSGFKPFLWDVNLSPMIFTKNFQLLSTYQTNNTGNDVAQQLTTLTVDDLIEKARYPDESPSFLYSQSIGTPGISQQRYLDNSIHLLNFNGLQKLSKDVQLRTNLYYVNDLQHHQAYHEKTLFLPENTLKLREDYQYKYYDNYMYGEITVNRNVQNNYFDNELKFKSSWDYQKNHIVPGDEKINEFYNKPMRSLSNEFNSIYPVKKHLISVNSYISYDQFNYSLEIEPGPFEGIFNDSISYPSIKQGIDIQRFFTDNSLGMSLQKKYFTITSLLGASYQNQHLQSNIFLKNNTGSENAGEEFINDIRTFSTNVYFKNILEFNAAGVISKLSLPVIYNSTSINSKNPKDHFFFNPQLTVDYRFKKFWKIRSLAGFSNRITDPDEFYDHIILQNYQQLVRNTSEQLKYSVQKYSFSIAYRNPVVSFFNTFSYLFTIFNKDHLNDYQIQQDGSSFLKIIELPNTNTLHYIQAYTSKFFSGAKTTLSLRINYSSGKNERYINGKILNITNQMITAKPEINTKIFSWLSGEYNLTSQYINSFTNLDQKTNVSLVRHQINMFAFPANNHMLGIETEYYKLKGVNNYFLDLKYRYTIPGKNIDLEINWYNALNNDTYTTYQVSGFMSLESQYLLRPSQILIKARLSF